MKKLMMLAAMVGNLYKIFFLKCATFPCTVHYK